MRKYDIIELIEMTKGSCIDMELWKDVEGYEGLYQVSSLGRMKSLSRPVKQRNNSIQVKSGKIIKGYENKKGYIQMGITKENEKNTKPMHRWVAEAFITNLENKPQINHIDGVKTNNNINNLEWVTNEENAEHARSLGLMIYRPENLKKATIAAVKANQKKVNRLCLKGGKTITYNSIKEAGEANGNKEKGISEVLNGRQKTAGGYRWEYATV